MITSIKKSVTPHMIRWGLQQENKAQARLRTMALTLSVDEAYERFEEKHPEWANSLFDRYFLAHTASPLLARYANDQVLPSARDLALAWASQFDLYSQRRMEGHLDAVTLAAADFLGELKNLLCRQLGSRPRMVTSN